MKALVVLLALVAGSLAQASESQGSISCAVDASKIDGIAFKFEARLFSISKSADGKLSAGVWEPKATYTESYDGSSNEEQVGRKDALSADANYKPRKYKDTVRFDLTNLVDAKSFGMYLPGDQCSVKIMIPVNAIELGKFKAPVIMNCDQSGGSRTLDCTATPRAR